jgi:hypothetical protein
MYIKSIGLAGGMPTRVGALDESLTVIFSKNKFIWLEGSRNTRAANEGFFKLNNNSYQDSILSIFKTLGL